MTLNTRWSQAEMQYALSDSGATILVSDSVHWEITKKLAEAGEEIEHIICSESSSRSDNSYPTFEKLIATSEEASAYEGSIEDTACIFYTGGTTGRAKGVMLSHGNFLANSSSALVNLKLNDQSVHLHTAPLFHLAGGSRVFSTSFAGGTHAVMGDFSPKDFLSSIDDFGVTVTVVVPSMLSALLDSGLISNYQLSSLQLLTYGASPMPERMLDEIMKALPHVDFLQSYGMTELSPVATMLPPEMHRKRQKLKSAGKATFNADVRVLDPQDKEVPIGSTGEICVRGPMVMKGYWKQPELTSQTLRNGWMHTGDLGYMDKDGYVFLVDRLKDMIISGGENVYSAQVEEAIYHHPDVLECAVIGIPSEKWGEQVHAVIYSSKPRNFSSSKMHSFSGRLVRWFSKTQKLRIF